MAVLRSIFPSLPAKPPAYRITAHAQSRWNSTIDRTDGGERDREEEQHERRERIAYVNRIEDFVIPSLLEFFRCEKSFFYLEIMWKERRAK